MKFSIPCVFALLSALCGSLFCQDQPRDYQKKKYTTEQGLPHNVIFDITRDTTGFLWIATWDGLSRFDGNEFRNYRHNPDDPGSLPFFIPSKLVTDRFNNLWILTSGRPVYVYNRAEDNFRHAFEGTFRDAGASDITSDKYGNIWVALDTLLLKYDPAGGTAVPVRVIRDGTLIKGPNQPYPLITFDNHGNIWYMSDSEPDFRLYTGPISGDTVNLRFAGSLSLKGFSSLPMRISQMYHRVHVSGSGSAWLSCRHGLFRCDTVRKEFILENTIGSDQINEIPFFCWADERTGINIRGMGDMPPAILPVREGEYPECVHADRSGTVWSANINRTYENLGLNRYTPVPSWFIHYLNGHSDDSPNNIVFPLLKDRNGDLWVGTRNMVSVQRIKSDGTESLFSLPQDGPGNTGPQVKCMTEDKEGIWFGTTDGRLFYFRFESQIVSQEYPLPGSDEPVISGIHNILTDGNGLVINGSEGIYRFEMASGIPDPGYRHDPPGTGFTIASDGHRGFWLGTWGSRIIHLDSSLQKTGEFVIGDGENIVEHICPGDSSDIWVALMGGGLGRLFYETGETEIMTTADGLSNNIIYSILRDSRRCLWISTNDGISMFNPVTRIFRNYGRADGLLISEFNSDSFFLSADGEMFFGGVGGAVGFYPDSIAGIMRRDDRKHLAITELKVSGINYRMDKAPYETDTFRLRKGDNNFQATMTLFDLDAPEKVMYRYRISGRDEDWIVTGHRNPMISFANLTHRDYRLQMEATNELGEWSYRKTIMVTIPHAFLEYPLVRVLFLLLFMIPLILFFISFVRHHRLKDRQMLDRLRLESLRSQMNPHFVFNSLSSINYFITREDKVAANEYIADFSRLIRSIIDNLGEDYISLERELQSLDDYLKLEHLRFGDRFDYSVSYENISLPADIMVFPGMIQPFVENAIWHGVRNLAERKGYLRIMLESAGPDRLVCIIEDDGIGRTKAMLISGKHPEHRSRGIEMVNERLRIFNAMARRDFKIVIEDLYPEREETGTRVIVDLPAGTGSLI